MKKLLLPLYLFLLTHFAHAQKEYDKWYFGNKAAIDFVSGTATPITNSAMNETDNPATMSDSAGNLLFYCNGNTLYNRNHAVMPNGNGILGHLSGGYTATAVRKPGNTSIYYLFTMDAFAGTNGLRYNVIDMNLNGGLGDIVAGQKNLVLMKPASEQVVPVAAANGKDIWLVTHPWNSSSFHSYPITCSGLDTVPIISTVGSYRGGGNSDDATAGITVNATNDRIAWASYTGNYFELFNFDNSTGILSNAIQITGTPKAWGIEFSPNGSKLYVSGWTTHYMNQYDLSSYNQTSIAASVVNLGNINGPGSPYFTGYMQRAPDGKIYMAVYMDTYLAVINNPDIAGTGCNLVDDGFYLGGKTSSAGLPDKIVANHPKLFIGNDTSFCGNFTCTLSTGDPTTIWSNGAIGAQIAATAFGTYIATITNGCGTLSDTLVISQTSSFPISLGNDTLLCTGQSLVEDVTVAGATYQWQDGSTNAGYTITSPGTYSVTVSNSSGCSATDAVTVNYTSVIPLVQLPNDTSYCGSFSQTISSSDPATLWSIGAIGPQITVSTGGTYWAQVSNGCGTSRDTVIITQSPTPHVDLGNDTTLCTGQSLFLDVTVANGTYHWQSGSTNAGYTINSAGNYSVTITNAAGCTATDDLVVTYTSGPPALQLPNDTGYCGNFAQTISTGDNNTLWSIGVTASQITVTNPGTYWAQISNGCGSSRDSVIITQLPSPSVNLGNDTALCNGQTLLLDAGNAGATFLWNDNSTASTYNINVAGTYSVTVTNSTGCSATDDIAVAYLSPPLPFSLGPDASFCSGASFTLSTINANTLWSTGATASQITVNTGNTYWAEISNQCGAVRDSVVVQQLPTPAVNLGADTTLCSNQSLTLSSPASTGNFLWNDGSTNTSLPVNAAGTYSLQVSLNGCVAGDTISIRAGAGPQFSLGPDTVICGNEFILALHLDSVNYLWQDNSTDSIYHVTSNGTYSVTVTNTCGSSTDEAKVWIHADECELHIPTAFSPNGDGKNDLFRATSHCGVPKFALHVYNRWGELVFDTDDMSTGWNGTFRNAQQPLGVYVYYIDYFNQCEAKQKRLVGNVTLIR